MTAIMYQRSHYFISSYFSVFFYFSCQFSVSLQATLQSLSQSFETVMKL